MHDYINLFFLQYFINVQVRVSIVEGKERCRWELKAVTRSECSNSGNNNGSCLVKIEFRNEAERAEQNLGTAEQQEIILSETSIHNWFWMSTGLACGYVLTDGR